MMRSVVSGHDVFEKSLGDRMLFKKNSRGRKDPGTYFKCQTSRIIVPDYDICNSVVQKMIAHVGDNLLDVSKS